jgi:hypothetical protein
MALLTEYIPKYRRELVGLEGKTHLGRAFQDKVFGLADFRDARQIALDIGREHRHAGARKTLGHDLQRHSFTGSGGAGDEAVAVGESQRQPGRLVAFADEYLVAGIRNVAAGGRHHIPPVLNPKQGLTHIIFLMHWD